MGEEQACLNARATVLTFHAAGNLLRVIPNPPLFVTQFNGPVVGETVYSANYQSVNIESNVKVTSTLILFRQQLHGSLPAISKFSVYQVMYYLLTKCTESCQTAQVKLTRIFNTKVINPLNTQCNTVL